jgi:hypothetical protein
MRADDGHQINGKSNNKVMRPFLNLSSPPTAKVPMVTRKRERHVSSFGQIARRGAARALRNSIAGRIGVISAHGAVVIAWGYHCCTDGSGTNADTYAAAHIGSAINAAPINAACMNAARADTAHATSAAIR